MATMGAPGDVTLSASLDRSRVQPGEQFIYTLTVKSESGENLEQPRFPSFENLEVLSGPGISQSFQIINGSMSRTHSYSFTLRSLKKGEFTIGPATLKTKKGEIRSEPVTVRVLASNLPEPGSAPTGTSVNSPAPKTQSGELTKFLTGKIFLRIDVNNKSPYVGEPIEVSYTLYAKKNLPIVSWGLADPQPLYKDFMKDEIYSTNRLSFRDVETGDKTFQAALIRKLILVPNKAGKVPLDPLTVNIGLRIQSRQRRPSFFDDPFGDSFFDPFGRRNTTTVSIPSTVVELDVQSLPGPRPDTFSGTVGEYSMKAKIDRKKATMDDLLTLSVVLEGKGAVDSAMEPKLPELEGFEVYETKAEADKKITANVLGGTKTFDYVLRPLKEGDFEIPGVSYSIFNPAKKEYQILKTDPIGVSIAPGTASSPLVIAGSTGSIQNKGEVVDINADINYIKQDLNSLGQGGPPLLKRGWFLGIQAIPLFFVVLSFLAARRRETLEKDIGLARRLKARGIAGKRLKEAARALSKNDPDAFYQELAMALRGFFGDKLNRESHGLTIEELHTMLEEREIPEEEIGSLTELLEVADQARYAPSSFTSEDMQGHFRKASGIIQRFGKKL